MSPPQRRGPVPAEAPATRNAHTIATADDIDQCTRRFAEDADLKLEEVVRWLDSLDLVAINALGGGAYSPADALEFVLVGHGKIREHLAFARCAA